MMDIKEFLGKEKIEYYVNHSIKAYLTMGVGCTVPLIVVVRTDDHLKGVLSRIYKEPFVLLGGGSNVVFPDVVSDPDLTVIINRSDAINQDNNQTIKVNSGVLNLDLMEWNVKHGIGGLDFLAGVPGTIGGAAAVNAGAFGESISTTLVKAEIFDSNGNIKIVANDYFQFQYRNSAFKYGKEVIINVFLSYIPEALASVRDKVDSRIAYRKEKHPAFDYLSAGCFFKNPIIDGQKNSAGKLIEQIGFKGTAHKGVMVADEHANFIVNSGNATFAEIQDLEEKIVREVAKQKGITLEREVIYITSEGKKY
jgi:UDP-N-acetylmuramate dehydrogenase